MQGDRLSEELQTRPDLERASGGRRESDSSDPVTARANPSSCSPLRASLLRHLAWAGDFLAVGESGLAWEEVRDAEAICRELSLDE